jgi:hypothetical protein
MVSLTMPAVRYEPPARPTRLDLTQALQLAATGRATASRLAPQPRDAELIHALSERERLVVIRAIHGLDDHCRRFLAHLHQHSDAGFALLCLGPPPQA